MPRPYSLETYSRVMDLDGFPCDVTPRVGLIVSLTLLQEKADEIREIDGRPVLNANPIKVHHHEEVFFRIVELLNDTHFRVEFYDFFGNDKVSHVLQKSRYVTITTPITADDRKNMADEFYLQARPPRAVYPQSAKLQNDLRTGKTSIEEAIERADPTLRELAVLSEQGHVTAEQLQQGRLLIRKRMQPLKAARRATVPATAMHEVETSFKYGGTCAPSRWLKAGDCITCYANNLHYLPAQLNKLPIAKPYYYRFQVVPRNSIASWGGAILDPCVLDWLVPGNTVRCCFDVIHTATGGEMGGGAWYFNIVCIDGDRVLGQVLDTYYSPDDYGLVQQFGNYVWFFKRNISEIPLSWSDNLKDFNKIKHGFGFAVSGARGETEYDITH